MSKLILKERFAVGVSERHVNGFGRIKFDPAKVDPSEYETYQKKGFDIFDEVPGDHTPKTKAGDKPRAKVTIVKVEKEEAETEVEKGLGEDKTETTKEEFDAVKREKELDETLNLKKVKEMAKDMKINYPKDTKKAGIIALIVEQESETN